MQIQRRHTRTSLGNYINQHKHRTRIPTDQPSKIADSSTSIPPRSSAYPSRVISVRPRYPRHISALEESDVTRIPTQPQPPVKPSAEKPLAEPNNKIQVRPDALFLALQQTSPLLSAVDDLDTRPLAIDELDTQPPVLQQQHRVKQEAIHQPRAFAITEPVSKRDFAFLKLLDRLRWWLLYPGRIEFLLWLSGTLLLFGVTVILSLAAIFSLGYFNGGHPVTGMTQSSSPASSPTVLRCRPTDQQTNCASSTASLPILKIVMFNEGPFVVGTPVQLRGQGFSAHGRINFAYDKEKRPCRPDSTLADEHGNFAVALMPGDEATWSAGSHRLIAYDVKTNRSVTLTVTFVQAPAVKNTPSPSLSPVSTPTFGNSRGANNTTVVPAMPLASPTTIPPRPSPQPTKAVPTAIPTPTRSITPTATLQSQSTRTPSDATPTTQDTSDDEATDTSSLALNRSMLAVSNNGLLPVKWLCWLALGYGLSMLLLVTAALLHRYTRMG